MPTQKRLIDIYWDPLFDTIYDSWFEELASEKLSQEWRSIDMIAKFFVAVTASGSAVAGWAFWTNPIGKDVWAVLAGAASVLSIVNGVIQVPDKVKLQESLANDYRKLRVDLDTFRLNLKIGIDKDKAFSTWNGLRQRYEDLMGRTPPDMLFTKSLSNKIKSELGEDLKAKGYIK